jgi:hypothetical protein
MFERKVSVRNVSQALQSGEVIEDYSAEMPEPARLVLGFQGRRPFHMVISENPETHDVTIVTVYIPDPKNGIRTSRFADHDLPGLQAS